MSRNTMIAIVILFCLVLGLYFFSKRPEKTSSNDVFSQVVPDFSVDSVDHVSVWIKGKDVGPSLVLKKEGGTWWVSAQDGNETFFAPCQRGRVKRLLESLKGIRGEERAKGKDFFPTFNIGDDEALHFELKSGDHVVAHILVGKRGAQWGTSFIRLSGDNRVYIVQKNLLSLVDIWDERAKKNPSSKAWIELAVVEDGPESIQGLSYSTTDQVWSLEQASTTKNGANGTSSSNATDKKEGVKGDGGWVLIQNGAKKTISRDRAREYLNDLFPLYAKRVRSPERASQFGLGKSDNFGRLTIHFKAKGLKIFHIGRIDQEKKVGWIRDERGVIYELDADKVAKLKEGPQPGSAKNEKNAHEQEEKEDTP